MLKHLGALIGAALGLFVFRSFWVGLFGAFIGNVFDVARSRAAPRARVADRDFVVPLFALLGVVAKSDGRVSEREIGIAESLMGRLQLDAVWRRRAIDAFQRGKAGGYGPADAIEALRQWTGGAHDLAYPIVDVVADTVLADGPPTPAKMQILRQLASALRLGDVELMAMLAMKGVRAQTRGGRQQAPGGAGHAGGQRAAPPPRSGPDPYAVLGLTPDADNAAVKQAYRKLISQHHPDRLGNLPEDLRRRAEERASAINAAYDRIKDMRGL